MGFNRLLIKEARYELELEQLNLFRRLHRAETILGDEEKAKKGRDAQVAELESGLRSEQEATKEVLEEIAEQLRTQAHAREALTKELASEISELRVAQRSTTTGLQAKVNELESAWTTASRRLRERLAANEKQIGLIRYPNAPSCIVFFGHHKCGSRFFREEVFSHVAEMTGARVRGYEIQNPPFHYSKLDELDLLNIDFSGLGENGRDIVLFANSTQRSLDKVRRSTGDWKAVRLIRDPRQVLVSDFLHDRDNHHTEAFGWIWDQLVKDKPILRELSDEDGLLYELDNISKSIIEEQLLATFNDERVLTIKIEDFSQDPHPTLDTIAGFLEIPDIAGIDLGQTHANPRSGPWEHYFTSRLREAFKERYGQALIELGYADDLDW